ncbi:hypothetical protein QJQ45_014081 [Haematococcus lacustris]|nr:hypothetical protein QJQ45_014081 [Haematococcus lacustris]
MQSCCSSKRFAYSGRRLVSANVFRAAAPMSPVPTSQLAHLDELLLRNDDTAAVSLARQLQEEGLLLGFGQGRQLPKRIYSLEELRLNQIDAAKLLSPKDKSLDLIRSTGQAAAVAGLAALALATDLDGGRVLGAAFALVAALTLDQVVNQGGGETLLVDSLGRLSLAQYRQRVALHEAGHFLVAYLIGILPRAYTLSAWDAFTKYRTLNLQAGTQFCDAAFQAELAAGRLSSSSLDQYACMALAGVVTEALRFGEAEGGVGDVAQLDRMMRALGFTQAKADGQVRWAVLNVAMLLRRHSAIQDKLAAAMSRGDSVGSCLALVEEELRRAADI